MPHDHPSFVHLTDVHISHRAPADSDLMTDTAATLSAVLRTIEELEPQPRFIVVSGDLTHNGETESYLKFAELMKTASLPVVTALGNHDSRPNFYAASGMEAGEEPYCHEQTIGDLHVIVLDSSVAGRIGGALDDIQFAFLEAALARAPERRKIVVVHHPPALAGMNPRSWESLDAQSSERLAASLKGQRVEAILCGHVHFDRVIHWNGIPVIVSTGLHNSIDLAHSNALRVVEGAGFALCTLYPSGLAASFVPLPRSRRELVIHEFSKLQALEDERGRRQAGSD